MLWVSAARGYLMVSHSKCPIGSTACSYSSCLIEQNKLSPLFWASQDMQQAEEMLSATEDTDARACKLESSRAIGLNWTDQSQAQVEQESRQPVLPDVTVGQLLLVVKTWHLKSTLNSSRHTDWEFSASRIRILTQDTSSCICSMTRVIWCMKKITESWKTESRLDKNLCLWSQWPRVFINSWMRKNWKLLSDSSTMYLW